MTGFRYQVPQLLKPHVGSITAGLAPLMSESRRNRITSALSARRRNVLCLFENTHHSHNVSAVLRTIEAMGFLEAIFVYTNPSMKFRSRDSVERGANQWLITRRARSIAEAGAALQKAGYCTLMISLPSFATTAATFRQDLPQFTTDEVHSERFLKCVGERPIALVFGSELNGVSPEWIPMAEGYLSVTMSGFVESLNLSVCAGIILHSLRRQARTETTPLSSCESELLMDYWVSRSTTNATRTYLSLHPEGGDYLNFVRSGGFFDPFPQSHCDHL